MSEQPLVLDCVIEGVPSPRDEDAGVIWPRALVEAWSPAEIDDEGDDESARRWVIRDPESDLELRIDWVEGPEGGSPGFVLFCHTPRPGTRGEDLLRVCELALRMAERLGKKLHDPVLEETFECEDWAYRLTEPFHARGYLATHFVRADGERVSWVHTHGMARFGLPDLEAFGVPEEEAEDVVAFLHEAAASWIREDAPVPSARPRRVDGVKVRVLAATVARQRAPGYDESSFRGHETPYVSLSPAPTSTVEAHDPGGSRGGGGDGGLPGSCWKDALAGWRPSSVRRSPVLVERLCAITNEILPEVRQLFEKGLASVTVKARFPVPAARATDFESMWVHVEEWGEGRIKGRLANEPERRPDLSCGSTVEVQQAEVWDVLVVEDGRPYRGVSLRRWLRE